MDHEAFDRVTRVFGAPGTRRAALGTLLGAALAGAGTAAEARRQRRSRRRDRVASQAVSGCSNPKPGQNLSTCSFLGRDLRGINLRGANLSGADFTGADLCGADLRGSNLAKTDFMGANLTRADLRGTNPSTANLAGATLCQTRLPTGKRDNSGSPPDGEVCCTDAECPAGQSCVDGACAPCSAGSILLPNGDCAVTCETAADCDAAGCDRFACSRAVTGPKLCDTSPQERERCTSHAECPPGSACTIVSAPNTFACFTICTPPGS